MKAPTCRTCQKQEWNHICKGRKSERQKSERQSRMTPAALDALPNSLPKGYRGPFSLETGKPLIITPETLPKGLTGNKADLLVLDELASPVPPPKKRGPNRKTRRKTKSKARVKSKTRGKRKSG